VQPCHGADVRLVCARGAGSARLGGLLPSSIPENVEYFKGFVRPNYRLNDTESQEVDGQGNIKYFSKRMCPYLVRVLWDPCYYFVAFSRFRRVL
jgi:hypothetical protein